MARWLVRMVVVFAGLTAALLIGGWIASEPRPHGTPGPEADALARRIETAVDKQAWDQIGVIAWNYAGRYDHLWDRKRGFARVRWSDIEVLLNLSTGEGVATRANTPVGGDERKELLDKAQHRFINDGFWLNPLVKLFDPGVMREIVKRDDGSDALLVTYGSGGRTPGDAYLWIMGPDDRPKAWKMWVSIIPLGGLEISWERWEMLRGGAYVATLHDGLISIEVKDVEAGPNVLAIEAEDPFSALVQSSTATSQPSLH